MKSRYCIIIVFLIIVQDIFGQSVWPGDVNNNGIVNKVDLLFLGYAFGEAGPARTLVSSDWSGNNIPEDWKGTFPNGINFLYADCNGDGKVNEQDAEVIRKNGGLTHDDIEFIPDEIAIGEAGIDPKCQFMNPPKAAPVDQRFNLEIGLGDLNVPVENLAGLSFTIDVDPDLIDVANTQFVLNKDAWLNPDTATSIQIQQIDLDKARVKFGFTRTDKISVSGSGSLGTASFIIIGDIVDFLIKDTVTFTIDSITAVNDQLEVIPIVPDILKLYVDKTIKVNTIEHPYLAAIRLFPNPNRGLLLIESSEAHLESMEVVNALGQVCFSKKLNDFSFQSVDFQHLESGLYWIKIYSKLGVKTRLVQKI